ncbi:MAG: GSU2403 family nucleotidyltransferase fold protein, partial [Desulfococcaceae bacterium]
FDNDFDYHTGLVKFVHPDQEIQFLTPALGRGIETPYEIKKLNINAEGLRYLTLLQDFKFQMTYGDVTIWLPEPEAFVIHKILVSQKRKDRAKRDRDLLSARNIGELCMKDRNRRDHLIFIFQRMPGKWQKQTLDVLKSLSSDIYSFLSSQRAGEKPL